jgi:folate-binding protein YgfZ
MEAAAFLVPANRGILQISGDDRVAFLQGLVSNDVARATSPGAGEPGRVVYAALLTAQGRFLHDFFIAAIGDSLYLDAEAQRLEDLRRRLSLYRLRSKVTLAAVSSSYAAALVFGTSSLPALGLPSDVGHAAALGRGIMYVDPRLPTLGARAILPREELDLLRRPGMAEGSAEAYEALRLSLGVPDGSRDLPIEKALLLENGFDELHGVDWKKGCYVGQELTARMKYRLLVRKRLMPVHIDGPTPPFATPIMLGDQEAGEMRSATGPLGLALLRTEMVEQSEKDGRPLMAAAARVIPSRPAADAAKAAG